MMSDRQRNVSPAHLPPLHNRLARVIGSDPQPLILVSHPHGINLDIVKTKDGDNLVLASGIQVSGIKVIAPKAASVPYSHPYWSGPGIGLWEAVARYFTSPILDQVAASPGGVLRSGKIDEMIVRLFAEAQAGEVVVAGIPFPLQTAARYVRIDPESHGFWSWDVVTERALPTIGSAAGGVYLSVRVFTPLQWSQYSHDRARTPPAEPTKVKAIQKAPRGLSYKQQGQPLIEEMRRMLTAIPPEAKGPWDAALVVSEKAVGGGTGDSKAKRLLALYSAAFGD
jgi:hypothetical protein